MKNITTKKLILYGIALVAAILLLVSLCFNFLCYDLNGLVKDAENLLESSAQENYTSTGFDMLSFKFTAVQTEFLQELLRVESIDGIQAASGVLSLLVLTFSVAFVVILASTLFLTKPQQSQSIAVNLCIVSFVIAVAYSVFCIVISAICNNNFFDILQEKYGLSAQDASLYKNFTCTMWISIILQAVCLAAVVTCQKMILDTYATVDGKQSRAFSRSVNIAQISALVDDEIAVINAICGYKKLMEDEVISSAEFVNKKGQLLLYTNNVIKATLAKAQKGKIGGIACLEEKVIHIIQQYKALFDQQILTPMEYLEKKTALLQYVIA